MKCSQKGFSALSTLTKVGLIIISLISGTLSVSDKEFASEVKGIRDFQGKIERVFLGSLPTDVLKLASSTSQCVPENQRCATSASCCSGLVCVETPYGGVCAKPKTCDKPQKCEVEGGIGYIYKCSNGYWTKSIRCDFGCNGDKCKVAVCTPGDKKCDGDILKTCSSDGSGWKSQSCTYGCDNKACKPKPAPQCISENQRCSSNEQCCSGLVCASTPYGKYCAKPKTCDKPQKCEVEGGIGYIYKCSNGYWTKSIRCDFGCNGDKCKVAVCTPGDKKCDGDTLKSCASDGSGWVSIYCTYGCGNKACKSKPVSQCTLENQRCSSSGQCCSGLICTETPYGGVCAKPEICSKPQKCKAEGTIGYIYKCSNGYWTKSIRCDFGCDGDGCMAGGCTPGEKVCSGDGNSLRTCASDSSGWITQSCTYGCENGLCISRQGSQPQEELEPYVPSLSLDFGGATGGLPPFCQLDTPEGEACREGVKQASGVTLNIVGGVVGGTLWGPEGAIIGGSIVPFTEHVLCSITGTCSTDKIALLEAELFAIGVGYQTWMDVQLGVQTTTIDEGLSLGQEFGFDFTLSKKPLTNRQKALEKFIKESGKFIAEGDYEKAITNLYNQEFAMENLGTEVEYGHIFLHGPFTDPKTITREMFDDAIFASVDPSFSSATNPKIVLPGYFDAVKVSGDTLTKSPVPSLLRREQVLVALEEYIHQAQYEYYGSAGRDLGSLGNFMEQEIPYYMYRILGITPSDTFVSRYDRSSVGVPFTPSFP